MKFCKCAIYESFCRLPTSASLVSAGISGVTVYENLFSGSRVKSTSEAQTNQSSTLQGLVFSFFQIGQNCGRRDKGADVESICKLGVIYQTIEGQPRRPYGDKESQYIILCSNEIKN